MQPSAAVVTRMHRRRFFYAASVATLPGAARAALAPTPAQTLGPFYPQTLPLDADNDLLRVHGQPRVASGTPLELTGRVLDADAAPLAAALVEIWQCDANGRYHHPWDRSGAAADPGFQGYGRFRTGADGSYRFRTIRPVRYPGRTPHVHFAVTAAGAALVTQMYLRGEPGNARDGVLARLTPRERERVLVDVRARADGTLETRFDIVLPG